MMSFMLLQRTIVKGLAGCGHHRSFFVFLLLSIYILSTLTMFFGSLKANRDAFFAKRHTGFYSIVKKDSANTLSASPPREEDLFDPSEAETLLDQLGICHSVRLRSWANLYLDEPGRVELRNGYSVIVVASNPYAEKEILNALSFAGHLPAKGEQEALFYYSAISEEMKQFGVIAQLSSPFGIPIAEKFSLSGWFTHDGIMASPPLLFIDRTLFLELTGREENEASDIILGYISWLQCLRLRLALPKDLKLIGYTQTDSLAKTLSLVSTSLHLLLLSFIFIVVVSCMMNSLTIAVSNRSKEINILRVFGYGNGLVVFLFCVEYLSLLVPAWIVGSVLCAGTAALLNFFQLSATSESLEMVFAGKELVMQLSAQVFALPPALLGFITVYITGLRTYSFLQEKQSMRSVR